MAHLSPFRAAVPAMSKIKLPGSFFKEVKLDFRGFLNRGYFKQDDKPAYYLHRVQTKFRSYTGLTTFIHVEDYAQDKVKRHEHTIRAKEEHVGNLYDARQALIKPIMLTYPNVLEIDALTNRLTFSLKPAYEFDYDDEHHTFWRIDQHAYIEMYTNFFLEKVPVTYIADGHHRSQTSLQYYERCKATNPNHTGKEPYNYMMVTLFPASEIEIHNYNRLIETINGMSAPAFLSRLGETFEVRALAKSYKPPVAHHLGMYLYGQWYHLTVKQSYLAKYPDIRDRLDVAIFNREILHNILGVDDVRMYDKISYSEGPKGTTALTKAVDNGEAVAAFNLYPVALEDMIHIADGDGVLPPKSTWFYPRLRSGFIAQLF